MKKIFFALLMTIAVSSSMALAQTAKPAASGDKKPCYVDANKNKVCDKYENHTCKGGNGTGAPDCRKSQAAKATTPQTAPKATDKKTK